jgi:hypothetical protein
MKFEPVQAALTRYEGDLETLKGQRDFLAQDHVEHCISHGISPSSDRPAPIRAYTSVERMLRLAIWAGAILGTTVFGVLNAVSLQGAATHVIFLASVVFALLVGVCATCLIARSVRVDIKDPASSKRADRVLLLGGALAVLALAVFMYMRFAADSSAPSYFPAAAMTFEVGVMLFTAAAAALVPLYSWPGEVARSYDVVLRDIEVVQLKINVACKQLGKEKTTHEENKLALSAHALEHSPGNFIRSNGSAADNQRGL